MTRKVFRTSGGKPGRYGRHVAALLRENTPRDPWLGDLARDLADVVDAARRDQQVREFMTSVEKLTRVLDSLDGGDDRERVIDTGDAGELPPGLAEVLGSGPEVGDAEES